MPRISEFYGILIYMFYADHSPAHFHAIYGSHEASVGIQQAKLLAGSLPKRASMLVRVWARLHRQELLDNWHRAREGEPLRAIEALR